MTTTTRISKRTVDALRPTHAAYDVFDADLRGFHVRVLPRGAKVYRFKYRASGRQRVMMIGEHGAPVTAEMARARAEVLRGLVRDGEDPMAMREAERAAAEEAQRRALSVAQLVERWLVEGRDANPAKRESSWTTDATCLRRHIVPLLGDILVRDLTRYDVERAQREIAAGATARDVRTRPRGRSIVKGGAGIARRSLAALSSCLGWAIDQGILGTNPVARVKKLPQRRMERFLTDAEAAELFKTIAAMEKERALLGEFADVIRLLLLTGARRSEIMHLQWTEVDLDRGFIRLPRERSKTGERVIPLSAPAVEILRKRQRSAGVVFPSPKDASRPVDGLSKAWQRVRRRAKLADVRIHDLRHSFASFAAANNASLILIGKALGHMQPSTTARYAHLGADPVHELARAVGQRIVPTGGRSEGASRTARTAKSDGRARDAAKFRA